MALGDSLPTVAAFSLVEGYILQRTIFEDKTFQAVCLGALGVNFLLNAVYGLLIWPFLLNPVRHLPKVQVCETRTKWKNKIKY
jgi:hypothetical protein